LTAPLDRDFRGAGGRAGHASFSCMIVKEQNCQSRSY